MRNNGPITNEEYLVPEGEVIITHTDPSSRITYANPAFLSSRSVLARGVSGSDAKHRATPGHAQGGVCRSVGDGEVRQRLDGHRLISFANILYIQSHVVKQLLTLREAAYRLLRGDTATRIPTEGVYCIAVLAEAMEQVRVKLDGVLKDNLDAASQVRHQVSAVVEAN